MSRMTLSFSFQADDYYEHDILQKIEALRKSEQFSSFCSAALRKALEDKEIMDNTAKNLPAYSEIFQDRLSFYNYINKRIVELENQINELRFDMHTAAVLSDRVLHKELSAKLMSTIDALFEDIKDKVAPYSGDYADIIRWSEREKKLIEQFESKLSNIRLIESALSLDDDIGTDSSTSQHNEETVEMFNNLLQEINSVKEIIKNTTIEQKVIEVESPEIKEETTPVENPVDFSEEEITSTEFSGDLGALAAFFGGM